LADNTPAYDVSDTAAKFIDATPDEAAAIQAAVKATAGAVTGSISVADAAKLLDLADNDSELSITLKDTPVNLAAHADMLTRSGVVSVVVDGAASVLEATTIHGANPAVTYTVADSAPAFLNANTAQEDSINFATQASVDPASVPDSLMVNQASRLLGLADNDAQLRINIVDSPANIALALDAKLNVIGVTSVTVDGPADAVQAVTIAGFTQTVSYSVSDTATQIAANTGGLGEAVTVTVTTPATVIEATTIHAARANVAYSTVDVAQSFLAADEAQAKAVDHATNANVSPIGSVPVELTVAEATKLLALADNDDAFKIHIKDTAANIALALDAKLDVPGVDRVTVDGTATAQEAATIASFNQEVVYIVSDTAEQLAAYTGGLAGAYSVSATTSATVEQATTIYGVRADSQYVVQDQAQAFLVAGADQTAAINKATTANAVVSSVPASLTVADAGKLLGLADNDTQLSINILDNATNLAVALDTSLSAPGVFSVTVDGTATALQAAAIASLGTPVAYSVRDTAEAIAANTSGLAEAQSVSLSGSATVAQALLIHQADASVKYVVEDSAVKLASVPSNPINAADKEEMLKAADQLIANSFANVGEAKAIYRLDDEAIYSVKDTAQTFRDADEAAQDAIKQATQAIVKPETLDNSINPLDVIQTNRVLGLATNDADLSINLKDTAANLALSPETMTLVGVKKVIVDDEATVEQATIIHNARPDVEYVVEDDATSFIAAEDDGKAAINWATEALVKPKNSVPNPLSVDEAKTLLDLADNDNDDLPNNELIIQLEANSAEDLKQVVDFADSHDEVKSIVLANGVDFSDAKAGVTFAADSGVVAVGDTTAWVDNAPATVTGSDYNDTINYTFVNEGVTIYAGLGNDTFVGSSKAWSVEKDSFNADVVNYTNLNHKLVIDKAADSITVKGSPDSRESVTFTAKLESGTSAAYTLTWATASMLATTLLAQAKDTTLAETPEEEAAAQANLLALEALQLVGASYDVDTNGDLVINWGDKIADLMADHVGVVMSQGNDNDFIVDKSAVGGGVDKISNIEGILGTAYSDVLVAPTLTQILENGDKVDVGILLDGGTGGNDVIEGGKGDDVIIVRDGNNTINAGDGADTITVGGYGNNYINSGVGNDTIYVTAGGNSIIESGEGDDQIFLGDAKSNGIVYGNYTVDAGIGDDTVYINANIGGTVIVESGMGDDTVTNLATNAVVTVEGTKAVTEKEAAEEAKAFKDTGLAADGKDTLVVGLGTTTTVKGFSLSTAAANLVGRSEAATNDKIGFVLDKAALNLEDGVTVLGYKVNAPLDDNGKILLTPNSNSLTSQLTLVALLSNGQELDTQTTVNVSWVNDMGLDLTKYDLSLLDPKWTENEKGEVAIETSLRVSVPNEILDTTDKVGLIGSEASDTVVLSAKVEAGGDQTVTTPTQASGGADVVVAGIGGDNYITRLSGTDSLENAHFNDNYQANLRNYQTILDLGSTSSREEDAVVFEGVRSLDDLRLERVELRSEGQSSLHIGYQQFDKDDNFFATGDLQIFGQLSEFSGQYHIEKLQIVEATNALDITQAPNVLTYFFGEQTASLQGGGFQVEADAGREKSLLIGATGSEEKGYVDKVDKFVINGIDDDSDGHEMYLFGAENQDELILNFTNDSALEDVMKGKVGAFDQSTQNNDGSTSYSDANGLVNVNLKGNTATINMTNTNNTAELEDDVISVSIIFADGGNVDSTFLNRIKWES